MTLKKPIDKNPKHVTLFYGSGSGFSGQRFAIELVTQGLRERCWQVRVITTPLRDRVKSQSTPRRFLEILALMLRLAVAWVKGLVATFTASAMVVSPGQTKFALIRDGLPLLIKGLVNDDNPIVVSLHGNLIINWPLASFEAKVLRNMVRAARYVTVLGPNQKAQLIRLGIPATKVIIVDNSCSISPITPVQLAEKQSKSGPLNVLYLSSLIESKGYPEFVEAIAKISRETDLPVRAVVCGKITTMDDDQRFSTINEAQAWLETQINAINQSATVKIHWIDGAIGAEKEALFKDAQIFVLPSRYKVEAQPIAIIEALASGCAVVTSTAGEIPAMVSDQAAILLDRPSADAIVKAILGLHRNFERRKSMATNGLNIFKSRFAYEKHIDRWEILLSEMSKVDAQTIYSQR